MSGITLYGPAEAPFTVKVERALQLKGVEYLLVAPESPEDYRRWNPETGLLPVLDRDGEREERHGLETAGVDRLDSLR